MVIPAAARNAFKTGREMKLKIKPEINKNKVEQVRRFC